jgi:hypothetical protein
MDEPLPLADDVEQVAQAAARAAFQTTREALLRAARRKDRVARQYAAACADWVTAVDAFSSACKLLPDSAEPRQRLPRFEG